ncbi:hypothetical protein F383_04986 [Gossypium arboreum]|uniref:Uncharacterized protein n=1 Tax=Gossypium arboreum TaxID=29729 RepID=A0A0B0NQR6_GOSAR|nr:hypothetical protein F383_04986 [Gossypium arboreum]
MYRLALELVYFESVCI